MTQFWPLSLPSGTQSSSRSADPAPTGRRSGRPSALGHVPLRETPPTVLGRPLVLSPSEPARTPWAVTYPTHPGGAGPWATRCSSRIEDASAELAERSPAADDLGRLPDDVAKLLKDIGIVRMLQPADFGGYEADPRDFLAAVMEVGHACPSAGWVSGVVGVHPWELALTSERLQEEVWGDDSDTWVASPYAPMGTATPVDGGYTVNGRWSFSSGTDLCNWVVLGASVPGGGTDRAPFMVHVMLPASRLRDRRRLLEGHGPRGHRQQGRRRS